ncbi:PAS domain-containing sensor histidine kinase [Lentilitoribacter sp. Alg239-R112]|jgi:signal transduction histidine kinase|uniref:sensor histidine kinase n=1 Tax=Lentilitoribacter sp. Alg239-R112 TaxID=2305987 RepID=UPI001FCE51D3|nr:PAS domain-containing sensor histidine kinase [Lentilitoribacter sp. Alg239-R112]
MDRRCLIRLSGYKDQDMPGENSIRETLTGIYPRYLSGLKLFGHKVLRSSKLLSLSCSALISLPTIACAQDAAIQAMSFGASPKDILYFSMVIGAITATMISAVWLIRERSKVDTENTELRAKLRDMQAIKGRYNSLIVDSGQKVVIWESKDKPTEMLGSLPAELSIPSSEREFLKFERWLDVQSATKLDLSLEKLRHDAESFDIVIETIRGDMLEVQGRVSGVCAFLRFVPLGDVRAKQASLMSERDRLVGALETFQNLLDVIEMPVWMRGSDGKLQWVNEAFAHATEAKSRQDVLDRGLELLGVQARENIKSNSTPERPFYDKLSTVVRGERRFFEVADSKSPSGSAGLAVDITAEEDIRSELENTLQGHVDLINNLSTPVAIFDRQQQLQFYNQAFQKLWDLGTDFLAGNPDNNAFFERLRADSKLPDQPGWKEWKAEMLSIYHSADPQQHLWHLPDGQTVHVLANANPQGGTIWVFENLTEKVDLETRYNRLQQVQGQTIDHLAEGVCVFASDGTLALSNPAFRALWALTEDQVSQGTHIKSIVPECEKSYQGTDGWRHFAEIITSLDDQRVIVEGRLELATGLILDYALVPVTGGLTMLTFVNMSDSVRAERMLTEKNDALIKAESLKNDFVQHVSYELRSPLTNIMGFTDLVRTPEIGVLNERQSEYLDHIATSSSVLLTIVNDILDLATVDAGIMKLDIQNVEITDLVERTQRQVADRMKENLLTLNVDLVNAPDLIRGDFQRLKQILVKLLGNAASASPKGSNVDLVVYADEDRVVFKVTDNGAGIPAEDVERIFARFESKGQNGQRGGAGLGLSIVQSFVGLHHGDVHIDSILGEGTTVICTLPLNCENVVSQTA